mmetsp:Transcript_25188/g.84637  ORF Transcript_25188/g.84637 Transcript_25188/m.84637 type:complete len:238 (-) Transcript_25188:4507-5220(-)
MRLRAVVVPSPLVDEGDEIGVEAGERVQGRKRAHLAPDARVDPPLRRRRRVRKIRARCRISLARDEEAPLERIHLLGATQDANGHHEREQELVLFEQGAADVDVDEVGEKVVEDRQSFLQVVLLVGLADRETKKVRKPLQRILVHRIDAGEAADGKVQDRRADGHGPVPLAREIDLPLGNLRLCNLCRNLSRSRLRRGQRLDQLVVVEDVARRVGELVQNQVLDLLQLLLHARVRHD